MHEDCVGMYRDAWGLRGDCLRTTPLFPWGWNEIQILCGDHPRATPRIPTQYFFVGMRGAMHGGVCVGQ